MKCINHSVVLTATLCLSSVSLAGVARATENDAPVFDEPTDAPSAAPSDEKADEDTERFRIGPLLGLGFPRPIALEGLVKIERVLGLGLEYSFLPIDQLWGVDTSFWAFAGDLRVFPFGGAFFIGARAGYQRLSAAVTLSAGGLSTTQSALAESWFVNPRLGFLFTWKSGFTLGIDAGIQVPVTASLVTTLPAGVLPEADASIARVAGTLGNQATPTVDPLRVGFLF